MKSLEVSKAVTTARHKWDEAKNAEQRIGSVLATARQELAAIEASFQVATQDLAGAESAFALGDVPSPPAKLRKLYFDSAQSRELCTARITGLQAKLQSASHGVTEARATLEAAFAEWSRGVLADYELEYLAKLDELLSVADDFAGAAYALNDGRLVHSLRGIRVYDSREPRNNIASRERRDSWRNPASMELYEQLSALRRDVIGDPAPESTTAIEAIAEETTIFDVAGRPLRLIS
jgi:hypothetical protein